MTNIHDLDLGPIKVKLMDHEDGEGWSYERVQEVEVRYKNFLLLHIENPEITIVPTKDVDKFWHYHILDTQKYAQDCSEVFGYFLHHFPYLGMGGDQSARELHEAFELTQSTYRRKFGHDFRDIAADAAPVKSRNDFSICDPSYCGADTIGTATRLRPKFEERPLALN